MSTVQRCSILVDVKNRREDIQMKIVRRVHKGAFPVFFFCLLWHALITMEWMSVDVVFYLEYKGYIPDSTMHVNLWELCINTNLCAGTRRLQVTGLMFSQHTHGVPDHRYTSLTLWVLCYLHFHHGVYIDHFFCSHCGFPVQRCNADKSKTKTWRFEMVNNSRPQGNPSWLFPLPLSHLLTKTTR